MVRETYKWVLVPMQEDRNGKGLSDIQWEHFPINPSVGNLPLEIERVLHDNELLISEWAPVHLANLLKKWFWKADAKEIGAMDVWQKMCCYLYLPRLKDESVFKNALIAASNSKDFFGFSYGKDGSKYLGFTFGGGSTPILDSALLLVEPTVAGKYAIEIAKIPVVLDAVKNLLTSQQGSAETSTVKTNEKVLVLKKRFYGTVELDPVRAKLDFARLADEILQHFNIKSDTRVKISVEIQAESTNGFDEKIQRTVKENSNVLRFKNAEFEKE